MQLKLGDPDGALPMNDPPNVPYTVIPRSSIVQVTKEDEHSDALLKFVPATGCGALFVTLHESTGRAASAKPVVEVRIDDQRIGQLTPQMSQRFLPMIRHLDARGLVTACWGDIKGSAVAAEVRIDGIKANEADAVVLDGDPVTLPSLTGYEGDPLAYDLSGGVVGATQPDSRHTYASERSAAATRYHHRHHRLRGTTIRPTRECFAIGMANDGPNTSPRRFTSENGRAARLQAM